MLEIPKDPLAIGIENLCANQQNQTVNNFTKDGKFSISKNIEKLEQIDNNPNSNQTEQTNPTNSSNFPLMNVSNSVYVSKFNSNNQSDNNNINKLFNINSENFKANDHISSADMCNTTSNYFINNEFDNDNFTLNKKLWTHEEDQKLIQLVNSSKGRNWKKISQLLFTKTPQQCAYRYNKLMSNMNKRKWSRNEDIILIELIEIYGHNWKEISQRMEERTFEEVKERYEKNLDPKLKRCKFKIKEDEMILSLFEQFGNKWDDIAKFFVDRSANMIKNRFYSHLRKRISKNNMFNIDTSQNEQNFDSKSLISSTQNNLSSKDIRSQENQSNFNLNMNTNMEFYNKSMDVTTYTQETYFCPNKENSSLFKISKENKNCDMYPDNLKYHVTPYDDITMKIDLSEINHYDYFNQNLDGIFNFNINDKNNTNLQNNFNLNSINNSLDFNNLNQSDSINKNNLFKIDNANSNKDSNSTANSTTDLNKIKKSRVSNLLRKSLSLNNIKTNSNYEMLIDDSEANNIPKELIIINTESPKEDFLSDDQDLNFKEHYDNIFRCKKNSFGEENIFDQFGGINTKVNNNINKINNHSNKNISSTSQINNESYNLPIQSRNTPNIFANNVKITNTTNNINVTNNNYIDNESLYKQYKMLEDVFEKVTDVSMYQTNAYSISKII
jgi:hypothetical protein